ncbi:subclass B1 metallo-beta-lactamase [Pyxidicoccus parkwayensis]|uniref:beta-lactamase n=2 Tax=Pyxidicoccus parkwayensis TaxID=2813578 RepID=A0ABX7NR94_9BACT|nr:subclass B1 metallo-beta-lactamase [Pyxidicoccus parkwaysis]
MMRRPLFRLCTLLLLATACASTRERGTAATPLMQSEYSVAEDIHVRQLAPGVWLHTTLAGADFDNYPANGLLIEDGEQSLLVDMGWNTRHAEQLMTWARDTLHRPVRAAVVTHFHVDRTGGVPALTARGIPVYGLEATARLAKEHGHPVPPSIVSESQKLGPVEVYFPGAGHAPDNIVVWHRDSGVLFGGCFVKDGAAKDLGNLSDADVAAWPASLERTRQRFPDMRVVVPGHGQAGGPELLTHTQSLLR